MELIDLSQEIFHRRPGTPSQPITTIWENVSHASYTFKHGDISFMSKGLILSDHCGTHVDAFNHIDPSPSAEAIDELALERFYTEAICLDFSHKEAGEFIMVRDLEEALARTGLEVRKGDTVLLRYGHLPEGLPSSIPTQPHERGQVLETYLRGFPGLDRVAALWLVERGVVNIGCDARSIDNPVSERYDADPPCPVHTVCRDFRILNTENLAIPARLVGRRFRYIGFPLKIKGGSGSPIRAVAVLGAGVA